MQMIAPAAAPSWSLTVLNDVCQARYIILADRHNDKPFHCCQTKDINLCLKKKNSAGKKRAMIIDTAEFHGNEGHETNSD